MQTHYICPQCITEHHLTHLQADMNEDNYYELECPRGHSVRAIMDQEKFELLGKLGFEAFVDGYSLQSVSTFAASLERCHEWYVRLSFLTRCGRDDEATGSEVLYNKIWKSIKKRTECQTGLFMGTYVCDNNELAPVFLPEELALRNDVVHNGYIPSLTQTEEFGQSVIEKVQKIIQSADKGHSRSIQILKSLRSAKAALKGGLGAPQLMVSFSGIPYRHVMNGALVTKFQDIAEDCKRLRIFADTNLQLPTSPA